MCSKFELFVKAHGKTYMLEVNPNMPDVIMAVFFDGENITQTIPLDDYQDILTAYYSTTINLDY